MTCPSHSNQQYPYTKRPTRTSACRTGVLPHNSYSIALLFAYTSNFQGARYSRFKNGAASGCTTLLA
jgi:hypothetical protein